ncbi:MAG TPA: hypothetical protein VIL78_02460 [Hanamia sp.]
MKQITKIQEPASLVQHRANQPAFYHNLPFAAMNDLRANLLFEQGHICCYCMKRIPEKVERDRTISYEMKVEHFQCQDRFEQLQLTYSNLFGACTGNEGQPRRLQTCDTKKANLDLSFNPTSTISNCETVIKYDADGEIYTDSEEINRQLNEVLNLNMQTLKAGRREVYLEVQNKVEVESKKYADKNLRNRFFQQEKIKWLTTTTDKYRPFCMVAVYYLNKKIRANK